MTTMLKKTSNREDNYKNINNSENESTTNTVSTSNATANNMDNSSENTIHNTLQKPRYTVFVLDMLNDFAYGRLKCKG